MHERAGIAVCAVLASECSIEEKKKGVPAYFQVRAHADWLSTVVSFNYRDCRLHFFLGAPSAFFILYTACLISLPSYTVMNFCLDLLNSFVYEVSWP